MITPLRAVLSCYLPLVSSPQPSRDSSVSRCSTVDHCWGCRRLQCLQLYKPHATAPPQTCSAPQACTTAAWGLLALLQLPFLQSLYICIFTKLQHLPELPLYIFLQGLMQLSCTSPQLVHLNACTSCTSPRAHQPCAPQIVLPYVCTSSHAPHLVNLTSWTSHRAHQLVHLYACTSCTSRASLHVHLMHISCISLHAPPCVHLNSCTSTRAPYLACTSRAPFALVHQSTSCTHQAHPSSHSRGTWTIPVVTV